jgi:hypothetical protein
MEIEEVKRYYPIALQTKAAASANSGEFMRSSSILSQSIGYRDTVIETWLASREGECDDWNTIRQRVGSGVIVDV